MPQDGSPGRLVLDLAVIALTLSGAHLLGRRHRHGQHAQASRFLGNPRALLTGGVVGLLAGAISVVAGSVLGGLVTAVLVAGSVAAVADRVAPQPQPP